MALSLFYCREKTMDVCSCLPAGIKRFRGHCHSESLIVKQGGIKNLGSLDPSHPIVKQRGVKDYEEDRGQARYMCGTKSRRVNQ